MGHDINVQGGGVSTSWFNSWTDQNQSTVDGCRQWHCSRFWQDSGWDSTLWWVLHQCLLNLGFFYYNYSFRCSSYWHKNNAVYFSFSVTLSCLQTFQKRDSSHPLIAELVCRVHCLLSCGIEVVLVWDTSDVGLDGNSVTGMTAKVVLLLPMSNLTVPHSDNSLIIKSFYIYI